MPHTDPPIYAAHCLCGCGGYVEIIRPGPARTRQCDTVADLILRGYTIERISRAEADRARLGCLDAPEAA